MKSTEVVIEDFSVISSDCNIFLKKNKVFAKGGYLIEDYFIFLKSLIISSDKIDHILYDNSYIISPHYRLAEDDLYISLVKVNIEDWSSYRREILDYKGKFNLIKKVEYFFNFGLLW